jgi:CDP-glucose 4,6-dehydratase
MGQREAALEAVGVDESFWSGRRVLITGATGFKGSWLGLWLDSMGAEATGFARAERDAPALYDLAGVSDSIDFIEGDVRDGDAVRRAVDHARPDIVLHLAAQPLVRRSFAEPAETFATNVMGTVNVLEAVRRSDHARVVVNVTTDKVYLNRGWPWGYRETEHLGGDDPYSASKAASELVTRAYRASFAEGGGQRIATGRAGNVIGGGDWAVDRLVPDIMRAALGEHPVVIRNPQMERPWQHVLCALHGYLLLCQRLWDSPEYAGSWNFGPFEHDVLTVGEIVDRLDDLWPGGIQRDEPAQAPAPPEARTLKLDSMRARELLGWQPVWDLDRALQAIVSWFDAYRGGADMRAETLEQIAAYQAAGSQSAVTSG